VTLLELWPFAAIRRNHALEHATIHIIAARQPSVQLLGRSDWAGFTLFGALDTDEVSRAVREAKDRLCAGESALAVHSHCGTNLATGMVLAGLTSYGALRGKRRPGILRVIMLVFGLFLTFLLARPLGAMLQRRVTTSADLTGLHVVDVRRLEQGSVVAHRIDTLREA